MIQAQKINPDSFLQSVEIEDNARKSYIVIGRLMVCWGQINVTDIPNGAFGEKTVKIEFPRWFSGTPQTIASIGDMGGLCGEYVTVQESSDRDVSLIVGHVGATSSSSCRVGWIAVGKRNF